VVWCDSETNAPGIHTGFALGRTGESVSLFDQNTNRVDAVTFGVQVPNYTVGRIAGAWTLTSPTTNSANQAIALGSSTNLVINEWMANAPAGEDDWLELYNRSVSTPASLQGLYMGVSNITFQLSALSFIGPGGFVQLLADENAGADHLDFRLQASGGFIVLYNEIGVELDRITYGAQQEGISQGRLPNGAGSIATFTFSSSPAASNYVLNYTGPILNEILAVNRQAVTNGNGRVADFVELYNPSGIASNLAGMRLSTDPDDPAQWIFPPGVSIPAGGYLVVWFDEDRPASFVAEAVLNTGHSIHGDGGSVTLLNIAGRPVDTISFGFQVPDQSIGRSAGNWALLSSITPGAVNSSAAALASASNLRINEWLASPANDDTDWIELYNLAAQPVLLTGSYVSDSAAAWALTESPIGPLSFIGANGFVKITTDGDLSQGSDHANFTLDADGEVLRLYNSSVGIIDTVFFGLQTPGVSQGRFVDGQEVIASFIGSATPGESNYRVIQEIVINEVLTHTDPPFEDAIELFNAGSTTVDVSGWYLSDSQRQPRKFRIPNGSLMDPGTFLVFYEYQFGAGEPDVPGNASTAFTLDSAHGDDVWLSAVDEQDRLTGYRTSVSFGAAKNGVSFGRFTTSEGADFPPLLSKTFGINNPFDQAAFRAGAGASNAAPKIGPIVINEIMYHPPDVNGVDNTAEEFIELHNITDQTVNLFDSVHPTNRWRVQGGVSFTFPGGITISNRAFALLVNFDPSSPIELGAFRNKYSVSTSIPVFGPYSGKLNNQSDAIELQMPDTPQSPGSSDPGFVPYMQVDRVKYRDLPPWPTAADGGVSGVPISIQKSMSQSYGNEGLNWIAGTPTAGTTNGLSFAALPSIVQQPSSFSVAIGSNVMFSVIATGNQPLSYLWRRNGIALSYATNSTLALSAVQSSDEGAYTVLVSNPGGSVLSAAAQLSIGAPPNITQQPRNQIGTPGGSATFTVGATGGSLVYQWLFNGTNLPGATASTVTLSNLTASAIGPYAVVITNTFGVATSSVAYIVINGPAITVDPQNQRVRTGESASFNVGVTGDVPLSYQWRKNNTPIATGTNATFHIASAQLSDAGSYDVIVSNPVGSATSLAANLTFHVTIAQQPQSLSVRPPTNVTFSVAAVGTGTLLYQWRFNGTNIDGASTSTLPLDNVHLTNNGDYSVVVTDDFGSVTSSNATLTVLVNPLIVRQPSVQLAMPGQSATFTVAVTNATLPIGYQWIKAPSTVYTNIVLYSTNCTFTIPNVQAIDSGNFRVTCTNAAGTNASSFAALTVGPAITVHPTNRTVNATSNTTFTVTVVGSSTMRYQWRLFGTNLPSDPNPSVTNQNYSITNVQIAHAGNYSVVVTNLAGGATSQVAVLTIRQKPAIVTEPQDLTVAEGDPVSFTVGATGGDLRYQWLFNESPLSNATNSVFNIASAQPSHAGAYSVVITNVLGATNSRVATLTVLLKPALSNPEMLISGDFRMVLTGHTNRDYDVEFTTNWINWSFLKTISYSNGAIPIIDSTATNSPNRIYRVKLHD
jgi:hypothetical protein